MSVMPISHEGNTINSETYIGKKRSFKDWLGGKERGPSFDLIPSPDNCHTDTVIVNTPEGPQYLKGSEISQNEQCREYMIEWNDDGTPKFNPKLREKYNNLDLGTFHLIDFAIIDELREHEESILAIVVDDSEDKLDRAKRLLEKTRANCIIGLYSSAEDALKSYCFLKHIDTSGIKYKTVFILDGSLSYEDLINRGTEVAQIIHYLSHEHNWEMPYFIGNSQISDLNIELKNLFPDYYIGELNESTLLDLEVIARELHN